MKLSFSALAVFAGLTLVSSLSWAGEYFPGQAWGQAIPVGYYKVIRPKIMPEEIKKEEQDAKVKPRIKHHRRRGHNGSGLHVEQVPAEKDRSPALVPQYDKRPDTMPED